MRRGFVTNTKNLQFKVNKIRKSHYHVRKEFTSTPLALLILQ